MDEPTQGKIPTLVAFGPQYPGADYLIQNPDGWTAVPRRGTGFETLMEKLYRKGASIQTVSFGEAGSYYIAYEYKDSKGQKIRRHKGSLILLFYPELNRWLLSLGASWGTKETWVTLGPRGSYWARQGNNTSHYNLPQELVMQLEKYSNETTKVTLGGCSSFLWWDAHGGCGFSCSEDLQEWIEKWTNQNKLEDGVKVISAALSPFDRHSFFVLLSNATASLCAPILMGKELETVVDSYRASMPPSLVTAVNDVEPNQPAGTPPPGYDHGREPRRASF